MSETVQFIPDYSLLSDIQKEKLGKNYLLVSHRKGETLFSQDKPVSYVMVILTGLVKVHREEQNQKPLILKIVGPGKYITLTSIFFDQFYQSSCMALCDCEVLYIGKELYREIISENGLFALKTLELLSAESIYFIRRLMRFSQKQVPGRIAEILLYFSEEIYQSTSYTLPFSRQELADFAYSTKESVSRTLTEFKNDRIIEIDDRLITLKSIDLLNILNKIG